MQSSTTPDNVFSWTYLPSPTMEKFHKSKALFRGIMGPIGSGKSVASCFELFRLAMRQQAHNNLRKTRWGVIRGSYRELETTTIKTWQDWFPPSICKMKMTAPVMGKMVLPLKDNTTLDMEVLFIAVETEEDTKKLLSLELTGVWFNEARELPWAVIRAAMGRIGRFPSARDGGHSRKSAIADTNPPDDTHWWYKLAEEKKLTEDGEEVDTADFEFFQQPEAVVKLENGEWVQNPHAENLSNLKDGARYYLDQIPGRDLEWIKVYLQGRYGTVQDGKPVYGANYNDKIHCPGVEFEPVARWPAVVAFDFGRTPAALFGQVTPRGFLRIINECVGVDTDIRALCRDVIKPLLLTRYSGCQVFVTGDPAGNIRSQNDSVTAYDILEQELGDLVVDISQAETNSLTRRLDSVKNYLCRMIDGKACLQVSPECKMLRRGFNGAYKFAKVRVLNSDRYREDPEKNMSSHIHDALQYLCMKLQSGLYTKNYSGAKRSTVVDPVVNY